MSKPAVVCDAGTGYIKMGYSDQNFPLYSYPSIVGRPLLRCDEKVGNVELKSLMVGDEAAAVRSYLELNHPMEEGKVNNWDDMEAVWNYGFQKMKINPKDYSIMMTEPVYNPMQNREKMVEVLFEHFGFERMQIGIQALLTCFAEGRMTATLLDSGDGVTHCIPIYEGFVLPHLITRLNIAGRHITNYLIKLLQLKGYAFNSTADFEIVREIKEKCCYVSANIDHDRKLAKETTCLEQEYKLPDNNWIKVDRERFEASELIFTPNKEGGEEEGISEIVWNAINKAPIDTRKDLYEAIVISGGTTMFPGFPTRLQNDMNRMYKERILKDRNLDESKVKIDIKIIDPPRRKYSVFIGGAFLAQSMKDSKEFWITKSEWNESGKQVLKKIGESMSWK